MRNISYFYRRDKLYAKIQPKSYRKDKTIKKDDSGVYLGRVIDKSNNVFYSRDRGIFTYDPITGKYGNPEKIYIAPRFIDGLRKRSEHFEQHKVCLNFGDSYFLYEFIKSWGYDSVINSLPYKDKNTLYAIIQYYILQDKDNAHAGIWYNGSIAQFLFPNANLEYQNILDLLNTIGKSENIEQFFESHIKWIEENVGNNPTVFIGNIGLPNNIHFPLTAFSNSNGRISREARITTVMQRDTGYPLMYRITPIKTNCISAIDRIITDMSKHDICTDLVFVGEEYYSDDNIEALYKSGIHFITTLPVHNRDLFKTILSEVQNRLWENNIELCSHTTCILRIDCKLGKQIHDGFAYIGYNSDKLTEMTGIIERLIDKKLTDEQFQRILDSVGMFAIISSSPYQSDEILSVYDIRHTVERFFGLYKEALKPTPLRICSKESLHGHLILSMISATIRTRIMEKKNLHFDKDSLFMSLSNQKCIVDQNMITICKAKHDIKLFYDMFKIKCPLYLNRYKDKALTPQF